MERVKGIGGVFFRAKDPQKLAAWYAQHLGLPVEAHGSASFSSGATTIWSPFAADTDYFPGPIMINFRVDNLERMLAQLRSAGAEVDAKVEETPFGRFGWFTDPEGNRVELWEG